MVEELAIDFVEKGPQLIQCFGVASSMIAKLPVAGADVAGQKGMECHGVAATGEAVYQLVGCLDIFHTIKIHKALSGGYSGGW
jgi:hypothetical protein